MKYAIYVEGKAEMLFVADVLQKYSGYDGSKCGLRCINLCSDTFEEVKFPRQGDVSSENYYQIVNVNNDNRVVSKIKKDCHGLIEKGFEVIIGLRDVYGDRYQALVSNQPIVVREKIEELHSAQYNSLYAEGVDCRLHFAVMEYETWMLALIGNFVSQKGFDISQICENLGLGMSCDYEQNIYHPFPLVQKIYKACGEDYHKHGGESLSFLSTLGVDDYEILRKSGRCKSFSKFLDSLLGGECPKLP